MWWVGQPANHEYDIQEISNKDLPDRKTEKGIKTILLLRQGSGAPVPSCGPAFVIFELDDFLGGEM